MKQQSASKQHLQPVDPPVNNVPGPTAKTRKPRQARTLDGELEKLHRVAAARVNRLSDLVVELEVRAAAYRAQLGPARDALERVLLALGGDKPPRPGEPVKELPKPQEVPTPAPAGTPAPEPAPATEPGG